MSQNIIKIPEDTILEYRCVSWYDSTPNAEGKWNQLEYELFGERIFENEEYCCIEFVGYNADNYYMIKKQDLLPYLKEESYEIY